MEGKVEPIQVIQEAIEKPPTVSKSYSLPTISRTQKIKKTQISGNQSPKAGPEPQNESQGRQGGMEHKRMTPKNKINNIQLPNVILHSHERMQRIHQLTCEVKSVDKTETDFVHQKTPLENETTAEKSCSDQFYDFKSTNPMGQITTPRKILFQKNESDNKTPNFSQIKPPIPQRTSTAK